MIKLKVLSSVLSLAVLSSVSVANAAPTVVGQLIASPSALVEQQRVGSKVTAYIEGDSIVTGSKASATVLLGSGNAKVTAAPNTVMAITDASAVQFSLTQGAFSVDAHEGQSVSVETQEGIFELASASAVNAVVSFQNGEFSAISKDGAMTVSSLNGVITTIEAGNAFVYDSNGATSLDVQAAGASGSSAVNTAIIVAGLVVGTVALAEISDSSDSDASPSN